MGDGRQTEARRSEGSTNYSANHRRNEALFRETKQHNSFKSNGDCLQFLLEFFLQVRSNFESNHASGLRPSPEEEESMDMDYEMETNEYVRIVHIL